MKDANPTMYWWTLDRLEVRWWPAWGKCWSWLTVNTSWYWSAQCMSLEIYWRKKGKKKVVPVENYWEDDPDWPAEDWQYEVANGDTRQGYWDWVKHNKDQEQEQASDASPSDPQDQPASSRTRRKQDETRIHGNL